jgi:hypothetical protein
VVFVMMLEFWTLLQNCQFNIFLCIYMAPCGGLFIGLELDLPVVTFHLVCDPVWMYSLHTAFEVLRLSVARALCRYWNGN